MADVWPEATFEAARADNDGDDDKDDEAGDGLQLALPVDARRENAEVGC